MSDSKDTGCMRTNAYIFSAARKCRYPKEELNRVIREVNLILGEMERDDAGLVERIEAVLSSPSRDKQDGSDGEIDEISLLKMAIRAVIGDGRDCRPMSESKMEVLWIYESNHPCSESPEEAACQKEYETFLSLAISAAINQLDEREKAIFLARFRPKHTIQETAYCPISNYSTCTLQEAASSLNMTYSTYRRKLNNILTKLQIFILNELNRFNK